MRSTASTYRRFVPSGFGNVAKRILRQLPTRQAVSPIAAAETAIKQKNWLGAAEQCQAILDSQSEDAPARTLLLMSVAQRRLGNFDAAETTMRFGIERFPQDANLASEYAELAVARKDWPEVIARCQSALDAYGDITPARIHVLMGMALRAMGKFDTADAVLCQGMEKHPEDPKLAAAYAELAVARKDWSEALTRCQCALEGLDEQAPASVYRLGSTAYRNLGQLSEAEAIVRRGMARFPNDVALAIEEAEVALARNDWPATIERCEPILESAGDKAYARVLTSMAYYRLGDVCLQAAMTGPDWPIAAKRLQEVLDDYGAKLPISFYETMREKGSESRLSAAHSGSADLDNVPNAVFIWIPKTAGTTVHNALRAAGCPKLKTPELARLAFSAKGLVTFAHMSYKTLVDDGYIDGNFNKNSLKFTFVRNPFWRAISLYFYVQRYIVTYNRKPSFLDFLELLNTGLYDKIGLYNVKNLSQCNPQARWLDGISMDFIGRVEEIEKDFQALQQLLKIRLPSLGLYKKGLYFNNAVSFGPQEKYLVEKIYDEDFVRFGYGKDLPDELAS